MRQTEFLDPVPQFWGFSLLLLVPLLPFVHNGVSQSQGIEDGLLLDVKPVALILVLAILPKKW